jgi:hypothetical protein
MENKIMLESKEFLDTDGFLKTYYKYQYHINGNIGYEWRRLGKLDSPNDYPALSYFNIKFWYKNGKLHRENNPAIIRNDTDEEWYFNGDRHRNSGPAVINGNIKEYWWKGKQYDFERWSIIATLNKQEKIEIILQYG